MNQNQKKKQLNRGLSVALALLLVVAVVVTVIAVVSAKRTKPTPIETSPTQTTAQKPQTQTTAPKTPTETTTAKPDKPIVAEKPTFLAPLAKADVSKEWSADIPVFSDTMEDYRVHLGVDLEADAGTAVYAAADGIVESVTMDPMMGQTVVLTHAGGYKTVYRNLQTSVPAGIEAGASVLAGTQIGAVGDTALVEISQAPHLHFELYADSVCENPLSYVSIEPIDAQTNYED